MPSRPVSLFAERPYLPRLDRRQVLEAPTPKFEVRRLPGKRGRQRRAPPCFRAVAFHVIRATE
jgi:hypothetical protein